MRAVGSCSVGVNKDYYPGHENNDNDVGSSSGYEDHGEDDMSSALLGMVPEHLLPEITAVTEVLPGLPVPIQRALIRMALMNRSEAALREDAIIYEIAWRVGFDSSWQFDDFEDMCIKIMQTAWPMDCGHEFKKLPPQDAYYAIYKALRGHITPFVNKLRMKMALLAVGQLRDKLSSWNEVDKKNALADEDWADPELMLYVVKFAPDALRFASRQVRDNKDVVKAAVEKRGSSLQFASERLRNDIDVVMAALAALKDNKLCLLRAIQQHHLTSVSEGGLALQHASLGVRGNKGVVWFAVQQCGHALEFASAELQNDEDIVWSAYQQSGELALEHASDRLRNREWLNLRQPPRAEGREVNDRCCCIIL